MYSIKFTYMAFTSLTLGQFTAIKRLVRTGQHIEVGTAFDLPAGYVDFTLSYPDGTKIYGGISPEGEVST